jgi:hypothetical protein
MMKYCNFVSLSPSMIYCFWYHLKYLEELKCIDLWGYFNSLWLWNIFHSFRITEFSVKSVKITINKKRLSIVTHLFGIGITIY